MLIEDRNNEDIERIGVFQKITGVVGSDYVEITPEDDCPRRNGHSNIVSNSREGGAEEGQSSNAVDSKEEEEDEKSKRRLICIVVVVVVLFVLGLFDSLTTKYAKRISIAFADWTVANAPWSFSVYLLMIIFLIVGCLPYGPLSLLLGAVLGQLYGFKKGVALGVLLLFAATMSAAALCFQLSRDHFAQFVHKKVSKSKALKPLRNLDVLIQEGQGFELVLLIRITPIPSGPSHYFLGTTSVTWADFMAGNAVTNSVFALSDILMGAGASSLRSDNPIGVTMFVIAVTAFFIVIGYVGLRAKRKLDEIDAREEIRKSFLIENVMDESFVSKFRTEEAIAAMNDDDDSEEEEEEDGGNDDDGNSGPNTPSSRVGGSGSEWEIDDTMAERVNTSIENPVGESELTALSIARRGSSTGGGSSRTNSPGAFTSKSSRQNSPGAFTSKSSRQNSPGALTSKSSRPNSPGSLSDHSTGTPPSPKPRRLSRSSSLGSSLDGV
jgi:uncharacterized membrane protein YdjX (TVP38/TMEM64 family)